MQPPHGYGPPGGYGAPPPGGYGGPPQPPGYGGYGPPQPPGFGQAPGYGSGMDPPPKKGMSGAVIALIAVGICAALGIGGCIVCVGIGALAGNQHEARVNCERRAFGNVSCNVLHTAGRGAAEICWDVKLACENGVRAEAHACEFVGEKSTSTRVILSSSIRNNTLCGPFAAMSVENVTARGR